MTVITLSDLDRLDAEFARTGVVAVDVFPRTRLAAKALVASVPFVVLGSVLVAFLLRENLWAALVASVAGLVFFAANFRLSAARWFLARYMSRVTRPQFDASRRRAVNISPGDWMLVDDRRASRVAFTERQENGSISVTLATGAVRVLGPSDRPAVGLLIPNVMSPPERAAASRTTQAPH